MLANIVNLPVYAVTALAEDDYGHQRKSAHTAATPDSEALAAENKWSKIFPYMANASVFTLMGAITAAKVA